MNRQQKRILPVLTCLRWGLYYAMWPGLFVYLRIGSRTRTAILVGDRILLVRSLLSDDQWGLPGGGRHRHEGLVQAAIREVREETGLLLTPDQLQHLVSEPVTSKGLTYRCHYFAARLKTVPPLSLQRHEIAEARWLPVAQTDSLRLRTEVLRALQLVAERA